MGHYRFLKYTLRHKWFVFIECVKLGIPWRGIKHDWTKFLPIEWRGYAERFKNGNFDYDGAMESYVYRRAWLHHQNHHDHHWQYWALVQESGEILCVEMPDKCRREMLADWLGVGKSLGKPNSLAWYETMKHKIHLHIETRRWVEHELSERFNNAG